MGNERLTSPTEGEEATDNGKNVTTTSEHKLFLSPDRSRPSARDQKQHQQHYKQQQQQSFKTVDEVYESLGQPGRYSMVIVCLLTLNNFSISPNHAIGVFIGYSPEHECHPFPDNHTDFTPYENFASYSAEMNIVNLPNLNGTLMRENVTYYACKAVARTEGRQDVVRRCGSGQWKYNVADGESSSVTEWGLVCDRGYLANLANTFYYIGVMVGGILFGYVSDVFGRKVALLASIYITVAVGMAVVFTHDLVAFLVFRTIMGVAIQGLQTSTFIRLVEMFTPRHREVFVTAYTVFWAVALVGLGIAAWIIKDWRLIQVAVIAQAGLAALYLWVVPESLRWLISQGKEDQSSRLVQRISRFNGVSCDHRHWTGLTVADLTTGKTKERASYFDLVKTPRLKRRTFLMCYITLATNVGYWGLTYNTTALVGNKYLNFTLGSVAEAVMSVINVFIIKRFGKKKALIAYFMCGGVCCVVMGFLIADSSQSAITVVMIISTLGRLSTAGLFVANDLYMAELFPTVVRNMGVGVCTFMGRIGAVFTPLIFTLGLYTFQQLPLIVFGLVTIAGGLIAFLLPETSKLNLPDTLNDIEMFVEVSLKKSEK